MVVCSKESNDVEVQKQDIRKALDYLYPTDEDVFELCALNVNENKTDVYKWTSKKYPMGGWFQKKEIAVDLALALDQQAEADAIYVTLNPCPKDLLASVNERIAELQKRTADDDVKQYRNLLIDIDPIRKAKISSSDEEHDYALEYAKTIMSELAEHGWPEPMYCDSGNGAHLLYKVEMDVSEKSIGLLKSCLKVLSQQYSNDKVDIDEKVFNPARITKLYGTHARKGDGSDERPHRLSGIISIPETPQIVTQDQLEALAVEFVEEVKETKPSNSETSPSSSSINHQLDFDNRGLDVKTYLDANQVKVSNIKKEESATFYCLNQCVFDPSHSSNDAAIVQNSDGSLRYQCFHNSCADKTWEDARKAISGDDKLTQFMPKTFQESLSRKKPQRIKPNIINAADLMKEEIPDIQWVVEGLIPTGLCMIAGKPKMGKSFFSLQLAIDTSNGTPFLNQYPTTKGRVLFLGLEDQKRRLKDRLERLGGAGTQNIDISFEWNSLNNGGLDDLQEYLDGHEDVKIIVIDTFACFRFGHQQSKDMYQLDYDQMKQIKRVADQNDVAILLVHHLRKTSSEDPFDQISGSTGIFGSLDTAMILNKNRTNGDSDLLITSRDIAGGSYAMSFNEDNCSWSLLGRTEEVITNKNDLKIIELLSTEHRPMKVKEIVDALVDEINDATIRTRLRRMLKKGQILQTEDRSYVLSDVHNKCNNYNIETNELCATSETCETNETCETTESNRFNVSDVHKEVKQGKFNKNSVVDNPVSLVSAVEGTEENNVQKQDESDTSVTDWFADIDFESEDETIHDDPIFHDDEISEEYLNYYRGLTLSQAMEMYAEYPFPDADPAHLEYLQKQEEEMKSRHMMVIDESIFEDSSSQDADLKQYGYMDKIDEITRREDLDDDEKFEMVIQFLEPGPVDPNEYLTQEETDFYENQFSDVPDEVPEQQEVSEVNMN